MIKYEYLGGYYWFYADKDIGKYGPFESVWVKGNFYGREFKYDVTNLKSWKNCIGMLNDNIFSFEELNGKLHYLSK